MSIITSVTLAAERRAEKEQASGSAASGTPAPKVEMTAALEKITAYIPAEVIGIYVAAFGILTPGSSRTKWIIFGLCLLLIPFFMWLGFIEARRKKLPVPGLKALTILLFMAIAAYIIWTAALPATPFAAWDANATRV